MGAAPHLGEAGGDGGVGVGHDDAGGGHALLVYQETGRVGLGVVVAAGRRVEEKGVNVGRLRGGHVPNEALPQDAVCHVLAVVVEGVGVGGKRVRARARAGGGPGLLLARAAAGKVGEEGGVGGDVHRVGPVAQDDKEVGDVYVEGLSFQLVDLVQCHVPCERGLERLDVVPAIVLLVAHCCVADEG